MSVRESAGGDHGAVGGVEVGANADVDADAGLASTGLVGADGSVSRVLRRSSDRTSYDARVR